MTPEKEWHQSVILGMFCKFPISTFTECKIRAPYITSIYQTSNGLKWAEGVILSIILTIAGVPDEVAALLICQNIGREPL